MTPRSGSVAASTHGVPAVTLLDAVGSRGMSSAVQMSLRVGAVVFMTALTAAAAQVSFSIPFTAVPFTLQPMVVLMAGLALGPRLGLASQVLYLAAGVAGLPVFAFSPTLPMGAGRLLGPTGGYLMSYPFAALLTGYLAERGFDRRYVTSLLAMFAGLVVIYACGTVWLSLFASSASLSAAIGAALTTGVYPFVGADVIKLAFAAGVTPALWRLFRPDRQK